MSGSRGLFEALLVLRIPRHYFFSQFILQGLQLEQILVEPGLFLDLERRIFVFGHLCECQAPVAELVPVISSLHVVIVIAHL